MSYKQLQPKCVKLVSWQAYSEMIKVLGISESDATRPRVSAEIVHWPCSRPVARRSFWFKYKSDESSPNDVPQFSSIQLHSQSQCQVQHFVFDSNCPLGLDVKHHWVTVGYATRCEDCCWIWIDVRNPDNHFTFISTILCSPFVSFRNIDENECGTWCGSENIFIFY